MMQPDTLMLRTVRGLEWVACDEIEAAGFAPEAAPTERTIFVPLGEHSAGAAAEWQTVDDAFFVLLRGDDFGRRRPDFQNAVAAWQHYEWTSAFAAAARKLERAPVRQFTVSASFQGKRNFSRFELEDALGSVIQKSSSLRYVSHRDAPPESALPALRLHLDGRSCSIGLRLRDLPLHRRAWKVCTAPGTLHPPVAAVISQFLRTDSPLRVADPFCGCGTILVELARRGARFHQLHGSDLSREAILCAARNAAAAGVELRLAVADAARVPLESRSVDALITNPPWGKQVEARDLAGLCEQFVEEADRLLTKRGCLIVLHDWESALRERIGARGFQVLHEQNLRTAGKVARLTIALRQDSEGSSHALDVARLDRARRRLLSTSGAEFVL